MPDDLTPRQTAAALHGQATNPTLPIADRLSMALQALDWYESAIVGNPAWAKYLTVVDDAELRRHANDLAKEVHQLRADVAKLRGTLGEVLSQLREKGHPGEPCVRTGWIRESTVVGWHQLYRETS